MTKLVEEVIICQQVMKLSQVSIFFTWYTEHFKTNSFKTTRELWDNVKKCKVVHSAELAFKQHLLVTFGYYLKLLLNSRFLFVCFKGILFLPASQVDSIYILHSLTIPTAKLRKLAMLFKSTPITIIPNLRSSEVHKTGQGKRSGSVFKRCFFTVYNAGRTDVDC